MRKKTKVLTSALAFVSALFLSGYMYLSVPAGRLLTASEFTRFAGVILWNGVLHSNENGGARSLRLAREALSSPTPSGAVEIGKHRYSFPLPDYSVRQEGQHYLTFASFDELQDYFYGELPAAGWRHVEQLGAGHFFEGNGATMVITYHFYLGTGISDFGVSVRER